jgi:4-aminobutyrate aminotransferase / (S)-3-amino-2-methylpropionate transaminase / 5-aminovalerate transaminase
VADRRTRAPDKALTARILAAALERGLVLLSAGTFGNVIRVLAPLTADDELIDEGLNALEAALAAAVAPSAAPTPWSPVPGRAPSTN